MPDVELERLRRQLAALEAEVARLRKRADLGSMRGKAYPCGGGRLVREGSGEEK